MAQADLNVANQSGSAFRADLNNQLLALGTLMSGASEPSTTYAYMLWADTANGLLKQRNAANSAWITVRNLDGTYARGTAGTPSVPFDGGTGIYSPGEDQVAIATGGTGRLFVDASGRILAGVSTALTNAYSIGTALAPAVQLEGNTGNAAALSITRHASAASNLLLQRGVIGTPVAADDAVGQINFNGFDGTNYFNAALIRGVVDSTPGSGSMPGRLSFQTTPSGSTTPIERIRIDASGNINMDGGTLYVDATNNRAGIGTSSPDRLLHLSGADTAYLRLENQDTTGSVDQYVGLIEFEGQDAGGSGVRAQIGAIYEGVSGATAVTIGTSADAGSVTERVRINRNGNVGIGTTSPGYALDVQIATSSANTGARIYNSTAGTGNSASLSFSVANGFSSTNQHAAIQAISEVSTNTLTSLAFLTSGGSNTGNATERARIDSSGRLLVGTSTSTSVAGAAALVQIETGANLGLSLLRRGDVPIIALAATGGSGATVVTSGQNLGEIRFAGADGTDVNTLGASIIAVVDGTPGADDLPTRLVFSTTADGASSPTEAMRINSGQELLIGYTADNGAYKLQVNSQIFATSATIATSDGRYKENVATLGDCVDLVKALRPVSFTWKPQEDITRTDEEGNEVLVREAHNFPDGTQVGFIAQEVQQVLEDKPWLGSVIKQNTRSAITDADGNELAPEEEFFGIAEGNLIAVLTSALQEAIGEIESLKARLTAAGF